MSDVFSYIDEANVSAWTKLDMLRINLESKIPELEEYNEGDCSGAAMTAMRDTAEKYAEIYEYLISLLNNTSAFLIATGKKFCAMDETSAEVLMEEYWENLSFYNPHAGAVSTSADVRKGRSIRHDTGRRGYRVAPVSTNYTCAVRGLVRDYSEAQKERLLTIVDSITPGEKWWERLGDWFSDVGHIISGIFGTLSIENHVDNLDKYHERVFDRRDYTRDSIKMRFEEIVSEEPRYGNFFRNFANVAEEYFNVVKALSDGISGTTSASQLISNLAGMAALGDLIEKWDELATTTMEYVEGLYSISDADLARFCEQVEALRVFSDFTYYTIMVGELDFGDVLLIALLEREDVIFDTLKGGTCSFGSLVKQMILEGKFEKDVIGEMAKQTGLTEDQVMRWLKGDPMALNRELTYDVRQGYSLFTDAQLNNLYLALSAELLKDDVNLQLIAHEVGYSLEMVKAITNGEIDNYSLTKYKELIADSLETIRGKSDYKDALRSEFLSDFVSYSKKAKTLVQEVTFEIWYEQLNERKGRNISAEEYKIARSCYDSWNGIFNTVSDVTKILGVVGTTNENINLLADLLTEYSSSVDILDALCANSENADPTYQLALQQLRKEYDDKMTMIFQTAYEAAIDKAGGEALKAATNAIHKELGPKFGKSPSLYAVVTTTIDTAAKVTGASSYASATMDMIGLTSICNAQVDAYQNAVAAVRDMEEPTPEALQMVRATFEAAKQSHIDIYKAMIKMEENHIFGVNEDQSRIAQLEKELRQLENLRMEYNQV